jgi:4-aminobutyrate aminotransferase-like enzyme
MAYEPYIELAERLNALAPVEGEAKTIFTTGAEATENAVKIARAATGRPGIIAFAGGFHGRTLLSGALTGKVNPYKKGLGPFPPEIYHLPLPSATNGVTLAETLKALDSSSPPISSRNAWPPSSSSRCRARAVSTPIRACSRRWKSCVSNMAFW